MSRFFSSHPVCFPSPDVFDLSLGDSCLQENEDTENGINPELAKVATLPQLQAAPHEQTVLDSRCCVTDFLILSLCLGFTVYLRDG